MPTSYLLDPDEPEEYEADKIRHSYVCPEVGTTNIRNCQSREEVPLCDGYVVEVVDDIQRSVGSCESVSYHDFRLLSMYAH
jgi:hypothetical protein